MVMTDTEKQQWLEQLRMEASAQSHNVVNSCAHAYYPNGIGYSSGANRMLQQDALSSHQMLSAQSLQQWAQAQSLPNLPTIPLAERVVKELIDEIKALTGAIVAMQDQLRQAKPKDATDMPLNALRHTKGF